MMDGQQIQLAFNIFEGQNIRWYIDKKDSQPKFVAVDGHKGDCP